MASQKLSNLPSLRKQQLLSEFSGLKQACPTGVFVTLTPGEPTLWSAVLFVRDGPYAPAVLRFQIAFPASYPQLPPIITFATDIFHPLITPLTTYMYTTDIQDNGTVSATDDERLPPGGFSLRHGFPQWFGRGRRTIIGSPDPRSNNAMSPVSPHEVTRPPTPMSPYFATPGAPIAQPQVQRDTSMYSILKYIKSTFDNAEVLDTVPVDAAGNPGAWQAWRAHRRKLGKLSGERAVGAPETPAKEVEEPVPQITSPKKPPVTPAKHSSASKFASPSKNKALPATPRKPGEWNWDGVWEDRVKKGISTSLSEPVLYGGATATEELVRFLAMDETEIESIKDNLRRTLEGGA